MLEWTTQGQNNIKAIQMAGNMIEPVISISVGITLGCILFSAGTIYGKRSNQIDSIQKRIAEIEKQIKEIREDSNEHFIRRSDRRRFEGATE